MARLSSKTGDYSQAGMIVDRQQLVAVGGETSFNLTFVDGSEEVYIDGARAMKGSNKEYTTSTGKITLTSPLTAGTEILLVGRASANEIPYNKASSETVVLTSGQTEVEFESIETDAIEIYINGPLVDRGRLTSPQDYELRANSNTIIDLKHTFAAGTVLEGVQGGRLAWVDANNLVVNDGSTSKSLSSRFAATQESNSFFIQTTGMNLSHLAVGTVLHKWSVGIDGAPYLDSSGLYPILKLDGSYWMPSTSVSGSWTIASWTIGGTSLSIVAVDTTSGLPETIQYTRRLG